MRLGLLRCVPVDKEWTFEEYKRWLRTQSIPDMIEECKRIAESLRKEGRFYAAMIIEKLGWRLMSHYE